MINHVTYHVEPGTLSKRDLQSFMSMLGLKEVPPDDSYEHGWNVRWFESPLATGYSSDVIPLIHLIETDDGERDSLALGHFCISGRSLEPIKAMSAAEGWLERDSGSGRIWLAFGGLRVEVRP